MRQPARTAHAGAHDHRQLVTPLVEELLDLRDAARADRAFDVGDRIRTRLADAGVDVRDTPAGAERGFAGPLATD